MDEISDLSSTDPNERVHAVLIVDDSQEDRFLLKRHLRKTQLPLVIMEASSGQAGLDLLLTPLDKLSSEYPGICAPVALFLDINMPGMNGWEFVEELDRRLHDIQLKPTVVLMYSTSNAEHERMKAKQYQVVANYIVKGEHTTEGLAQAILACSANG